MDIKRFDIPTEIEMEALRMLLAQDPDPNEDPTMKQVQGLAILTKAGLKGKEELRHGVLRVITGVPIISQWGLSSWAHHTLIKYFKEDEDNDDPKKRWAVSYRGRRLIAESARIAEAVASQYEDHVVRQKAQSTVWDLWQADKKVCA